MTVDLDALIAEARGVLLAGGPTWETDAAGYIADLADALESTLAELRQEREQAGEAASHAVLALAGRRNAVAALSRAEETIDRIDGEVKNFEQSDNDALCEIERHLTEYGKQKEGDRGDR